tara:strand:+ start:4113 stop:4649 length:537 start_codon:yes stop_codon:yes gene_type:complete
MINVPYDPQHTEQWLMKFFKKDYYKKPYDRFMWWRSYTPINKALTNRHPFKDRIMNGDFNIAPYKFEAELVEHRMNKKFIEVRGYEDTYREAVQVDKARRKRLLEDYEKEEAKRLEEVRRGFVLEFRMTKDQYDKEVTNTRSKDLLTFYFKMETKYGTRAIRPDNVPKGLKLALDRNS